MFPPPTDLTAHSVRPSGSCLPLSLSPSLLQEYLRSPDEKARPPPRQAGRQAGRLPMRTESGVDRGTSVVAATGAAAAAAEVSK